MNTKNLHSINNGHSNGIDNNCGQIEEKLLRSSNQAYIQEETTDLEVLEKYEIDKDDKRFLYMMLNRLQEDCKYYLGFGNRCSRLWAREPNKHIMLMKAIYRTLEIKPEWISMDDILMFEKSMI